MFFVVSPQKSFAKKKEKSCEDMFSDCIDDWYGLGAVGFAYCSIGYAFCRLYMKPEK